MRWLYLLYTSIEIFSQNHGDMVSLRHGGTVLTEYMLGPLVLDVNLGKKKDSGMQNGALGEP